MYTFIRNLVGVKTDQAVNSAVEAIVRWDPQSATEAELRGMEQHPGPAGTPGGPGAHGLRQGKA